MTVSNNMYDTYRPQQMLQATSTEKYANMPEQIEESNKRPTAPEFQSQAETINMQQPTPRIDAGDRLHLSFNPKQKPSTCNSQRPG